MERYYRFAGQTVRVSGPTGQMYRDDGILTPFVTVPQQPDHTVELNLVERLPLPEGECVYHNASVRVYRSRSGQIRYEGSVQNGTEGAYMRICRQGSRSLAEIRREPFVGCITPKAAFNAMEAEHMIVNAHGFLLHASFIAWHGRAILFTAPSGTGKSTQAELWRSLRGAQVINGDRVAVMCTKEGILASGVPCSGSSGISRNETLPLGAVVYLSQDEQTWIKRLTGRHAFARIWEGCCVNVWNREDMALCSDSVIHVAKTVPVWHLACRPDETAVETLEAALRREAVC